MEEYDYLVEELQKFLDNEEIINNDEIINAYDYINLLRRKYNSARKVEIDEELVRKIDKGFEICQKKENALLKNGSKKEINTIESIEVYCGFKTTKIRLSTSNGETFICRDNLSKDIYLKGNKISYLFVTKYLNEFNRLLDEAERYLLGHLNEFDDWFFMEEEDTFSDGIIGVNITYNYETGVKYNIYMENDTEDTINKRYLYKSSLKEMIDTNRNAILKRIPVNLRYLGPIGKTVTKGYVQAYKEMQLNKKRYY